MPKESSGGWLCPDRESADAEAPVGVLDLTARPANAIKQLRIHSVSQLMDFSMQEFAGLQAIGAKSVADVQSKLGSYLDADAEVTCGILTRDEAISCIADDCSEEQATIALELFNDIECPAGDILRLHLLEVEPGVYCVKSVGPRYTQLLELLESALQQKPVSESRLRDEILGPAGKVLTTEQLMLLQRMLSISPSVIRLANNEIALSRWIDTQGRTTGGRAEAVLLHLGRPAHLREISENVRTLFKISEVITEGAILAAILRTPKTFVRVGPGTYGLKVWAPRVRLRREHALLADECG